MENTNRVRVENKEGLSSVRHLTQAQIAEMTAKGWKITETVRACPECGATVEINDTLHAVYHHENRS